MRVGDKFLRNMLAVCACPESFLKSLSVIIQIFYSSAACLFLVFFMKIKMISPIKFYAKKFKFSVLPHIKLKTEEEEQKCNFLTSWPSIPKLLESYKKFKLDLTLSEITFRVIYCQTLMKILKPKISVKFFILIVLSKKSIYLHRLHESFQSTANNSSILMLIIQFFKLATLFSILILQTHLMNLSK